VEDSLARSLTQHQGLYEACRPLGEDVEGCRSLFERELMREKSLQIECALDYESNRFPHTANVFLGLPLVRIDYIQTTPVPPLQIDSALSVLVIARDHQPRSRACQLGGDIQSFLGSYALDHTLVASTGG
jgi:hypothetical protein